QPPSVHALAHAVNAALGSVGTSLEYSDPVEVDPVDHAASLRELVSDIDAGRVEVLVVLGGNPAYTTPADVSFATSASKAALSVHLGLFEDDTAAVCQWHIPELHPLESWSDARAFDGTATILQPLIAPLYDGHSVHELLAAFGDQPNASSHDIVRGYWQSQHI